MNCCRRKAPIIQLIPSTSTDCPSAGCPRQPQLHPGSAGAGAETALERWQTDRPLRPTLIRPPCYYWFALLGKRTDAYRKGGSRGKGGAGQPLHPMTRSHWLQLWFCRAEDRMEGLDLELKRHRSSEHPVHPVSMLGLFV